MIFQRRFIFILFSGLLFINQLVISQNDYLKNDSSIYIFDIGRLPKVKNEWKSFIKENSVPFKSIESDDYADLMFLKDILKDKQYVFLGESSHIVKEFNEVKYRLIKFLNKEMDFEVITFESNLWDCYNTNIQKDSLTAKQMLANSIYGVWHTTTLLDLMEYIKNNDLTLSGFDIKESGKPNYYFEENKLKEISPSVAKYSKNTLTEYYKFKKYLSQNNYFKWKKNIGPEFYSKGNEIVLKLKILNDSLIELKKKYPLDKALKIYQKDIENKTFYTSCYIAKGGYNINISKKRDSLMATTLTWLIKEIYPDKKIIFGAHNAHISKNIYLNQKRMGAWLPDSIRNMSYFIGLYMYRGITYTDKVIKIKKPYKNSLEAIMIQPQYKYSFCDFSKQKEDEGNSWIFQKTPTLHWGMSKEKLILRVTYDGLIFIDKVSLPKYIFDYEHPRYNLGSYYSTKMSLRDMGIIPNTYNNHQTFDDLESAKQYLRVFYDMNNIHRRWGSHSAYDRAMGVLG